MTNCYFYYVMWNCSKPDVHEYYFESDKKAIDQADSLFRRCDNMVTLVVTKCVDDDTTQSESFLSVFSRNNESILSIKSHAV